MRRIALVIVLALLAGSASAQTWVPWSQNNIGVYEDPDYPYLSYCAYGTGTVTVHLMGTNLTAASVGGFECKITLDGPAYGPLNITYPTNALNLNNRENEYSVGYGDPVPCNADGNVVFMTFDLFVTDATTPVNVYLSPIYYHSLPQEVCAYLDGSDNDIILPLYNSTGDPRVQGEIFPVFTLNSDCVVPAEQTSWGDVKSLFR